jgi:2-polyprenyl-3-methyl-5-hydroxy-6-metoxy-1,4-benzoquinol methylase
MDGELPQMIESQAANPLFSGDAVTLARLGEKYRRVLRAPIAQDNFLSQVARGAPSHQFLGRSAQAVYARQAAFLAATLQDYERVPAHQIKILDWGCGKGHITYLLQDRGFDVTSCDVVRDDSTFGQEVPLIRAKGIPIIPLHHPSQLPFDDKSFDCVVSFGVLEHVQSDVASLHETSAV